LLLVQEAQQVLGRTFVEACLGQASQTSLAKRTPDLSRKRADCLAKLVRSSHTLALPERDRSGHARCRRDQHAVARDLLDAPCGRAQQKRLPGPSLVDHLLVELADASAAVDEVHAEKTAVGDRARVRHSQPAHARPAADHAGGAVPDDPRLELRELVRRIAAGEHVEHVVELRS
jgi:hypothetical protein